LKTLELVEQFVSPLGRLRCVLGGLGLEGLQGSWSCPSGWKVRIQSIAGPQGTRLCDSLAAGVPVAAAGAHVAAHGGLGECVEQRCP
jgi:hypothetical protein